MKVSNHIGSSLNKVDSAKTSKSEAGNSLNGSKGPKGPEAKGSAETPAKVNVSERARMMQKAKDVASDSTVDEARVAELQKMIDRGEYKTDASAIADRLVDEHLLMND